MPTINVRWADNTAQLRTNLKEGVNQIEATRASVEKMVKALSGENLLAAAHKWTAAISEMGGVEKLTTSERERANAVLDKALEKYKALGQQAPQALRDLAAATRQVEAPTSALNNWLSELSSHILSTAAGFISAQAVMGAVGTGVRTLTGFLADSVKAYAEAESAQVKLTAALRSQGTATPQTIKAYNDLAAEFQQTTIYSDDLINSMQGLLVEVGNVMPDQMKGALKASTDLASGLGIDLETATRLVAKAAAGHTETLGKYGITVDQAALKTEGFDAVLAAINRQFGGQATAQVDTYAGSVQQLANNWNNVQEAVGKAIAKDPLLLRGLRDINAAADDASRSELGLSETLKSVYERIPLAGPLFAQLVDHYEGVAKAAEDAAKAAKAVDIVLPPQFVSGPIQGTGISDEDRKKLEEELQRSLDQARAAAEKVREKLVEVERAGYQDGVAMQIMAGELTKVGQKDDSVLELAKAFDAVARSVQEALNKIREITSIKWPSELGDLLKNLGALGQGIIPSRITVPPGGGVLPSGGTGLKPGLDLGKSFSKGFEQGIADIPGSILRAIEGGGHVGAAIGSTLGESIGASVSESLSKSVSTMADGLGKTLLGGLVKSIPAFGALLGPLLDKLFSIGGPSKEELAGRDVVSNFEKQFSSVEDMINKVGAAYIANGKSATDAQAAIQRLWAAEKQGAEATKAALAEITAELQHQQEISDATHAAGAKSNTELQHAADIAREAYEAAAKSGDYTQENLDKLYVAYQQALADAGNAAAKAWLKAHDAAVAASSAGTDAMSKAEDELQGLIDQRNQLAKGIAQEAPEEVMGVIETQQRGQLAALDDQIQQKADAYAKLADDTGQAMKQAIVDALKSIHIDPIHIGVVLDGGGYTPPTGGAAGGSNGGTPTSGGSTGPSYQDYVRDYWAPDRDAVLAAMSHADGGVVRDLGLPYLAFGGLFQPRGTDTQPAMLTPGEGVVTTTGMQILGEDGLAALNGGQAPWGGDLVVKSTLVMDGQVVAENIVQRFARDKKGVGTKARRALGVR